jgi:hypothetical protein
MLFNNYSKKLTVPILKRNETVQYRLLGITKDEFGRWIIPAAKNVPTSDYVFDPGLGAKNGIKSSGDYIDIKYITSVNAQGEYQLGSIWFERSTLGTLILRGGSKKDQDMYQYLEACNFNASNPHRDTSVRPIFECINETKTATKKRQKREWVREAMNLAADMSDDEVKTMISALGKNEVRPLDILRDELEEFAMKDPKGFMSISSNKQKEIMATIKRGLDNNIISFNTEQSRFVWANNQEMILTTPRGSLKRRMDSMLEYIINTKQGAATYEEIVRRLKE